MRAGQTEGLDLTRQAHSGRLNTVALCGIISATTGSSQAQTRCKGTRVAGGLLEAR